MIAESVVAPWPSILHSTIRDPCFAEQYIEPYRQGRVAAIADIEAQGIQPCYVSLLKGFQVRANLIVPILRGDNLWGLLIAHHCASARPWLSEEIDLMVQLANQLGIATQQAELYQQTRLELIERRVMQSALEASEERFRSLSEAAPIGICQFNADGTCLYVNRHWQDMSGLSLGNSLADGWMRAIHPLDRADFTTGWNQFIYQPDEAYHRQEFRLLAPDGTVSWVSATAAPMYDGSGAITGYVCAATNITAQKQYAQQLQLLELAIANVTESVLITQLAPETGITHRIVYANPAFVATTGYPLNEVLNRSPRFLQGTATDPDTLSQIRAALDAQRSLQVEILNYHKDGSEIWFDLSLVPLRNPQDQVTHWVSVRRDITARKRAARKIQEQAALINVASDAILVRNLDNKILFWNEGAERLYGWTEAEVLGRDADTLFIRESLDQLVAGNAATLATGAWQGELTQLTKLGREITVASRWTLLHDAFDQTTAILEVSTDITEKKQLEKQFYRAQRLESIGTLASGIAHDLNNVFTPILAIAQMLQLTQKNLDGRSQEMLKLLESSTKRGAKLVKQILVFARGTEGKKMSLQAGHLLLESAKIAQQTFPKSIQIVTDIPVDTLWPVLADATQLQQVFMNLCVNACDAMPNGGSLTLSASNFVADAAFAQRTLDAQEGRYLVVAIADNGIGIPPENLEYIFDPFFTTKSIGQGTGLGLSTVLGIVKNHGGFVQVSSQVDHGTEFRVYLPATEDPIETPEAKQILWQGNQETILIVDDEFIVQRTNRALLESYNYRTLVAANGLEALNRYTRNRNDIQLVIMDIMMPEMDGFATIRSLRDLNPEVKIIAVSGLPSNRRTALKMGAQYFLAKPYSPTELLDACHTLLQGETERP
ncbi:MAG: PAS domain S-box protein [Leptolyngbyaceae cyanobacterium T60_A2020_046]|nr:PAS domain S-box protein [Leptolyngbyaceae cyanobacterium T60_A2020_046]